MISLTDFFYAAPSVYNVDLVGGFQVGPDGQNDNVGGITFSVTSVPEPQLSLWLMGLLAVAGVLAVHRRARHPQKN
jgi:hypothetical protein